MRRIPEQSLSLSFLNNLSLSHSSTISLSLSLSLQSYSIVYSSNMATITRAEILEGIYLPPGFRFHPTDEELLLHYLHPKTMASPFSFFNVIPDVDLPKYDPWELPSKVGFGENEWYFFSPMGRKHPNGSRIKRDAGSGYWKATGTDKTIVSADGRRLGVKKALVFCVGKLPKGTKTNWIMHEYKLFPNHGGGLPNKQMDNWVVCRIYKKRSESKMKSRFSRESDTSSDDMFPSHPAMDDWLSCLNQDILAAPTEITTECQRQQFINNPASEVQKVFSMEMTGHTLSTTVEHQVRSLFNMPQKDDVYDLQ